MKELGDYREFVREINKTHGQIYNEQHMVFGLLEEVGELAGLYKRKYRQDFSGISYINQEDLKSELGDILFYYIGFIDEHNLSLEEIIRHNIEKLVDRKERGVLEGKGDHR